MTDLEKELLRGIVKNTVSEAMNAEVQTEAKITFRDGSKTAVREMMTFDKHVQEAKKIPGAVMVESLDGKKRQTL